MTKDAWSQTPAENFAAKSLRAALSRACSAAHDAKAEIERLKRDLVDCESELASHQLNAKEAFGGLQKLGLVGPDETLDAAIVSIDRYGGKTTRHGNIEIVDAERPD